MDRLNSLNLDIDFGSRFTPVLGVELEAILPFRNNTLSVFSGISLFGYSAEDAIKPLEVQTASVGYTVTEIPFGMRYYYLIKGDHRLYVNAYYSLALGNGLVNYSISPTVRMGGTSSIGGGFGYLYKERVSLQVKGVWYTTMTINSSLYTGNYQYLSLIGSLRLGGRRE